MPYTSKSNNFRFWKNRIVDPWQFGDKMQKVFLEGFIIFDPYLEIAIICVFSCPNFGQVNKIHHEIKSVFALI